MDLTKTPAQVYVVGVPRKVAEVRTLFQEIVEGVDDVVEDVAALQGGTGFVTTASTNWLAQLPARPGDSPILFADSYSGKPSDLAATTLVPVATDEGNVLRRVGHGIMAPRWATRLEPQRIYYVRGIVTRRADPGDPNNHTIRLGAAWLGENMTALPGTPYTTLVTQSEMLVASGRMQFAATVSITASSSVMTVAPDGAVYMRPFIQTFGEDGQSDIEVISVEDVTDTLGGNIASDLLAQAIAAGASAAASAVEAEDAADAMVATVEGLFVWSKPFNLGFMTAAAIAVYAFAAGDRGVVLDGAFANQGFEFGVALRYSGATVEGQVANIAGDGGESGEDEHGTEGWNTTLEWLFDGADWIRNSAQAASYLPDVPHAVWRSVYLRLRDSLSTRDTKLRDDAVASDEGTDNAAYLSDILEHCASKKIPLLVQPRGYGGDFWFGSQVDIQSNTTIRGWGGRFSYWGVDADGNNPFVLFNADTKTDISILDLNIDGDQYGGSARARDQSILMNFDNCDRVRVSGGSAMNCWSDWGIVISGEDEREWAEVSDYRMLGFSATAVYMSGLIHNAIIRNCVAFGDKNRIAALGTSIDDRFLIAFHNPNLSTNDLESFQPVVENIHGGHSNASCLKLGNVFAGRVQGVTSYCCGWALDVTTEFAAVYTIYPARNLHLANVTAEGGRIAGVGAPNASFRFNGCYDVNAYNFKSRFSEPSAGEPEAGRPTFGVHILGGASKIRLSDFDLEGMASEGVSCQGGDTELIDLKVENSGAGAVTSVGADPTGYLRIIRPHFRSLFRDDAVGDVYRAISVINAVNLTEIVVRGLDMATGLYARSGIDYVPLFLSGNSVDGDFDALRIDNIIYDGSDVIRVFVSYNPPSVANGAMTASHNIAVPGAEVGDRVIVKRDGGWGGLVPVAIVSAPDVVTAFEINNSGGVIDLAPANIEAVVTRQSIAA